MKASIRKMGNSQGILLPKPVLAQAGMELGEVEMTVEDHAIVIRRPQKKVRVGWAEASKDLAAAGDDALVWPEFPNGGDEKLVW